MSSAQEKNKGSTIVLKINDIHAGYGKGEILRGVSLTVNRGEIVALIGPNGAGKSTLLKVIAGLLEPRAGQIIFRGEDITRLPAHRRARAGIAYVIQGGSVFQSLTASDHIQLGRLVAEKNQRASGLKLSQGIIEPAVLLRSERAGLFSGGQRQALAVATMLATNPCVLLCDEPSAGLAPSLAHALIERIAQLSREANLPVLWVEQRLNDVLSIADRAVLLRTGSIVAETEHPKEWLVSEVLSQLTFGKNMES